MGNKPPQAPKLPTWLGGPPSGKQQRLDNASKTGVYTVQDKNLSSFPNAALEIEALRFLKIENCSLQKLPGSIAKRSETLQRLELNKNKLVSLPVEFGALLALQKVDLSNNLLEALPDCWASFPKLKELFVSNNKLQASLPPNPPLSAGAYTLNTYTGLPASLGLAGALQLLDASSNKIASLPDALGDLANLQDLDVSQNLLVALPASLASLKRIKRINLAHNGITEGGVPSGLLTETPVDHIRLEGNPMGSLKDTAGFEEYDKRNEKLALKNIDQRVRTGDLSQGLGTAEQFKAMRQ
ncbi:hypothetical protein T484DRAFT_1883383 [Baffinella frigidus]|nr:hypothetical protein T484DRAFT_1883383 [Cryptophyta sp. CCMP2293]